MENWAIGILFSFIFSFFEHNGKNEKIVRINIIFSVQTLTTKDCKGPQTNMPKNIGSIKT